MRLFMAVLVAAVIVVVAPSPPASTHVPHDVIDDVATSPAFDVDGTVHAISRGRLMRSTDRGATWSQIVRGITGHGITRLVTAPSSPSVLYLALAGQGVSRSVDRGSTWKPTAAKTGMAKVTDLVVSPTSSQVVFAAGVPSGLFRTVDGGVGWTKVGSFGAVTALAHSTGGRVIAGTANGTVSTSTNRGSTWTSAQGLSGDRPVTALATRGSTVFAGTEGGRLFRSTDQGSTFTEVGGALPDQPVMSVTVSPTFPTDRTVWLTTWSDGVFRSTDRGGSFARTSAGLSSSPQADQAQLPHYRRITVAGTGALRRLFVAGFGGMFLSDDGASTWQQSQTLTDHLVGLSVSPNYRNDATLAATTYVKGAYLSIDRGAHWSARVVGLGETHDNGYAPLPRLTNVQFSPAYASDGTIFSAAATYFLKSTNRGESWTTIGVADIPAGSLQRLFIIAVSPAYASDGTVFLGARDGRVYRSSARGNAGTWSEIGQVEGTIRSLVTSPRFPAEPVLFASTSTGVHKSVDAGRHWTRTGPAGRSLLAISPAYGTDRTLFAGTESGLFVTRDAGAHWTKLTKAPLGTSAHVEAIAVSPAYATDRTVLVSLLGAGLYRSTDGGTTFSKTGASLDAQNVQAADFDNPTSAPIQFSPDFARDRTVFAMAQTKVVRSTDGGTTWQVFGLPPAAAMLEPPSIAPAPTVFAVREDAGQPVRIAIDLSHPSRSTVTVRWRTVDAPLHPEVASSTEGDYVAASGQLTFPGGSTRQYIDVAVLDDDRVEQDEMVLVALSKPSRATVAASLGAGIIRDDD